MGFDFAFGYPAGFAAALGLKDENAPPWRRIWSVLEELIRENGRNRNNRFEVGAELNRRCVGLEQGPFWGRPGKATMADLPTTCPRFPFESQRGTRLQYFRQVEAGLQAQGVQSVWKLFYRASVGGQTVVGIPTVQQLRHHFERSARIWPFETGFNANPTPARGPFLLLAEIWPRLFGQAEDLIVDRGQVKAAVAHLKRCDDFRSLGAYFGLPAAVSGQAAAIRRAIVEEEGWIVGGGCQPCRDGT